MSKINNDVFDMTNLIKSNNSDNTFGRSRCWFFTWNNHIKENLDMIISESQKYEYLYVMQEEISENNTPHLQFVLKFKNQKTFKVLKEKYDKCHIKKAKSWNVCKNYCKKYSTRVDKVYTNVLGLRWKKKLIAKYFRWQEDLIKLMNKHKEECNTRNIIWVYDENGGKGKTVFIRHWCREHPKKSCAINGKASDMKHFLTQSYVKYDIQYEYVFLNFPRTFEDNISYHSLEEIKDGFFPNSENGSAFIDYDNNPIVVVMANFLPNKDKILKKKYILIDLNKY